jgi:hypothetical protein
MVLVAAHATAIADGIDVMTKVIPHMPVMEAI